MYKLVTALLLILPTSSFAQTPEEKGLAIAVAADKRDLGWLDSAANMQMVLSNKLGESSTRDIRIKSKETGGEDNGDMSLTVFDSPNDVKGTAFLSYSHIVSPDDQWLYLPALKRVKRISSSNKSGPFMGSEFAFEDLSSFEVGKYTYKYLGDEQVNGTATFKVEYYPTYKHSGYKKMISWMDHKEYRVIKTEFYDRKGDLLKTLDYQDYQLYLGQYWRAHKMSMVNHQNEKSTDLLWSDFQFQQGLTDDNFNKNSLKRVR